MSSYLRECCQCIPQRWVVAAMAFFAFFNAYTLRQCFSMAITKMAVPLNVTEKSIDDTCPDYEDSVLKNTTFVSVGIFEWSEYTQGIILSSFYWGYIITHLPGGLLAEKYGSKYTVGLGVLITAILTVLIPTATFWGDANALITLRFLMGLCEGVIQPGLSSLIAQWIPSEERSVIGTLVYTGIRLGMLVSSILSGLILRRSNDNWPFIFHLFGGIAIIWFLFWSLLCYNNPREHPFITTQEISYLREKMGKHTHEKRPPFPWTNALRSKVFLALVLMNCGNDWCSYTIMSDLPKYMNNVLRLPVHLNGYASSLHNLSSWVFSMITSMISDWLIAKGRVSRTNIRKINTSIASAGPGVMLVLAMYAGCNVTGAIALITIGLTLSGSYFPGLKVNVLDLSPNYAGTLMGISNGIGALMGILAPYTVGVLAPNQTLSEWRLIFWIVAIIYFVTSLNFVIFASGDVQEWNDPMFLMAQQNELKDPEEDKNILSKNRIKTAN